MKPNRRGFFGILGALVGTKAMPEVAPLPPPKVLLVIKPLPNIGQAFSYYSYSLSMPIIPRSQSEKEKELLTLLEVKSKGYQTHMKKALDESMYKK